MAFNKLTPAEAERLALLAEECAEVIQVIGKVLRHGFENHHPDGGPSNRELLERECGDVGYAVALLVDAGDLDALDIERYTDGKAQLIAPYLHHQARYRLLRIAGKTLNAEQR
jgi:NTP pyrophosphatase (non-canonical NTP hydrolase)